MSGYYKTSKGKAVELKQQNELNLWSMDIVELIIPDGCVKVDCTYNKLKELIIPDGCRWVWCHNNQLEKLIIPDVCKYVSCFNNQLKELIIHDGCEWIWADMKSITELNKVENLYLWI